MKRSKKPFKKAGIFMDNYKVPTFETNLKKAGFTWVVGKAPPKVKNATVFIVEYQQVNLKKLKNVVKASNEVCRGRN